MAAHGASIVVNDPGVDLVGNGSDHRPAQEVVAAITRAGSKAVANFGSVTSETETHAMVAQALEAFGRIDIVINNAGNFMPHRPFEQSSESFASVWQVHVMGTVNVVRAAWPHMRTQRHGRIINIGSHVAYLGLSEAFEYEYAAAKGAIHGLTRMLAKEGASFGICANVVAPGAMTRPVEAMGVPPEFNTGAFAADLVAPTLVWLAHDDCKVTGEVFGVMAGSTTRVRIAETRGVCSRSPTPELIRDRFDQIMADDAGVSSGLEFPESAELRGAQLIESFVAS
jgi:NAD(P)-dependent dehydrogenase (short-subunit alcohol dehydrogenase family)